MKQIKKSTKTYFGNIGAWVKAHYGDQKMLSQILFFKTMQLSISTKPILKEVFINYIQNKVVQ
jgi:hypothetical protein